MSAANRQIEIIVREDGISTTGNGAGANTVAQMEQAQTTEAKNSTALSQGTAIGFMMAKDLANQITGQVGELTGSSEIQARINDTKQAIGWGIALVKFPKVAIPALAVQGIMFGISERHRLRIENQTIELNRMRGGFDRSTYSRSYMYD